MVVINPITTSRRWLGVRVRMDWALVDDELLFREIRYRLCQSLVQSHAKAGGIFDRYGVQNDPNAVTILLRCMPGLRSSLVQYLQWSQKQRHNVFVPPPQIAILVRSALARSYVLSNPAETGVVFVSFAV